MEKNYSEKREITLLTLEEHESYPILIKQAVIYVKKNLKTVMLKVEIIVITKVNTEVLRIANVI